MTPVPMTAAQVRALGLEVPPAAPRKARAPRTPALPTFCATCGERCDGEEAQARHVRDTAHVRYRVEASVSDRVPREPRSEKTP